jgi:hypothetical protein
MYDEFIGISQEVSFQIEMLRSNVQETKNDILKRVLLKNSVAAAQSVPNLIDLGGGLHLPEGEKLYLFLSKPGGVQDRPDGLAEVRSDGLYVDGKAVQKSRLSLLHPAMKHYQRLANHFDKKGSLISLNAYEKWHVIRRHELVAVDGLRDAKKRRKRSTKMAAIDIDAMFAELETL